MKIAFYVHQITPHLMPLARELVKTFGADEVRYVYCNSLERSRKNLGWDGGGEPWVLCKMDNPEESRRWLLDAEILYCEYRDIDLLAARTKNGKKVYYTSERWYKPIILMYLGGREISLPGFLRLLCPSYFRMARSFAQLFARGKIVNLVDGPHCARDFLRTIGLFGGDVRCLFRAPQIEFEKSPGGAVRVNGVICENIKMWGYFVAHSGEEFERAEIQGAPKVLWVGRYLRWKRIDTLIKAARNASFTLDLYGAGPMKNELIKLSEGFDNIHLYPPVSVSEVRKLMQVHDVYVLSSNGYEGWGAVVNEALEERMRVLGSYEAGASSAILPEENLFHCWDSKLLRSLILKGGVYNKIGDWSVRFAAAFLINNEHGRG